MIKYQNKLELNKNERSLALVFHSDIVASFVAEFRSSIQENLDERVSEIDVDMHDVDMVDSIGIGFLVWLYNAMEKKHGLVVINNLSPDLKDMFGYMRLNTRFDIR